MRRALLALAGTGAGLVGVLSYRTPPAPAPARIAAATAPAPAPASTSPGVAPVAPRVLTGQVAQTRWGPVQVAVTLTGTRITGVQVLQSPSGNHRDLEIAAFALPQLQQETLQAQSAEVDAVSGATYTSEGYRTSLQSALDQK